MTRFVVCGETLIDLVQADAGGTDSFSSTWLALSAGGPMNSAVALGKLGADTHFLGRVSRDAFGRQLRQHILEANVKIDLATESSQATSIAVVSLDEHGVAATRSTSTTPRTLAGRSMIFPSWTATTGCTSRPCPAS